MIKKLIIAAALFIIIWQIAAQSKKLEMDNIKNSQNFKDGKFLNREETPVMSEDASTFKTMMQFIKGVDNGSPENLLPSQQFNKSEFSQSDSSIKVSWFGHSSVIMNIKGLIILTDPVFSKHASPLGFMGNKSFDMQNPVTADLLPNIDIVLISHDHYDHLDKKTIKQLTAKTSKFIVPLGVASILKKWNVPESKIIELDWDQEFQINETDKITSTTARHFAGRGLKRNTTQWCSYVINIGDTKLFFSGDSGYGEHFKQIGEKHGPFDLTFMECGQYHNDWRYIHMNPSETYQANKDLGGKKMIPLHWAKFKLSLHEWTEPVDLLLQSSNCDSDHILTPEIGETIQLENPADNKRWWKN